MDVMGFSKEKTWPGQLCLYPSQGYLPIFAYIAGTYLSETYSLGTSVLMLLAFFIPTMAISIFASRSRIEPTNLKTTPILRLTGMLVGILLFTLPIDNAASWMIIRILACVMLGISTTFLTFHALATHTFCMSECRFEIKSLLPMAAYSNIALFLYFFTNFDYIAIACISAAIAIMPYALHCIRRMQESRPKTQPSNSIDIEESASLCPAGNNNRTLSLSAYLRNTVSFAIFGTAFSAMLLAFTRTGFATGSAWTAVGFVVGIILMAIVLHLTRPLKVKRPAFVAYRLMALPMILAFFPFNPGTPVSLNFAFFFTFLALSAFLFLIPFIVKEMACLWGISPIQACGTVFGGLTLGINLGCAFIGFCTLASSQSGSIYSITLQAILFVALIIVATNMLFIEEECAGAVYVNTIKRVIHSNDDYIQHNCQTAARIYQLTNREAQVLEILAKGYSISRVQCDLHISEGTAISHRRNIYRKLGVHQRDDLIDTVRKLNGHERMCDGSKDKRASETKDS